MSACTACGAPIVFRYVQDRQVNAPVGAVPVTSLAKFNPHEVGHGERWIERDGLMVQAAPGWEGQGFSPHVCGVSP